MKEKEIWKRVPNVDGILEVSNFGNIRKISTVQHFIKNGYVWIRTRKNGKTVPRPVHRLVAEAFCKKTGGNTVDHIDGNKENNRASNLQWVSLQENLSRAVELGLAGTRVHKFDSEATLVCAYPSISCAAADSGQDCSELSRRLSKRKIIYRKGFFYSKCADVRPEEIQKLKQSIYGNEPKKVGQYAMDGTLIAVHKSLKSAALSVGAPINTISNVVKRKNNVYRGFVWELME